MLKTATVAITSSLATALLLGFAFANPSQEASTGKRSVSVKFEWIQVNPKISESLSLVVDDGKQGTVTRPTVDGRGNRKVVVSPTVNENGTVTLNVHIQSSTSPGETLDTVVTIAGNETKAISASSSKGDAKLVKGPSEELVFVTPTVE